MLSDDLYKASSDAALLEINLRDAEKALGSSNIYRLIAQADLETAAARIQELEAAAAPRPLVSGLQTRHWIEEGTMPWNPEVRWADLQPEPWGPIQTGALPATTRPYRLRVLTGRWAPAWVKTLAGGPVTVVHPQGNITASVPRWWEPEVIAAHGDFMTKLARAYDGVLDAFHLASGMTIYGEPFQRSASVTTSVNLRAAGFTAEKDIAALEGFIDQAAAFRRTRVVWAVNPYQRLNADGFWNLGDEFTTQDLMGYFRSVHPNGILQNDSIRESYVGKLRPYFGLYEDMVRTPGPRSFQTAMLSEVGDLAKVIEWAIGLGAHALELPRQWETKITAEQAVDFDTRLRGNA